eukprot:gene22989-31296_t
MLCEIGTQHGLFALWATMTVLGLISMLILSSFLFYPYYVKPTFERWQKKNNAEFPDPITVKREIIHMCKGLFVATLCPAFTLMMSKWGYSHGYCGVSYSNKEVIAQPFVIQAIIIFFFTDLYEYAYHWVGHRYSILWNIHKHHHKFFNPSPFAVIADEYVDQFVRTLPMIILPLLMPINMDLLFAIFATLFYGYGVYLHWGYESTVLTAHNPIFNTAYHHYTHHAISSMNRPIYTGFFFKLWDHVFGTTYPGNCSCYQCRPRRSQDEWAKVKKPDYSVLLSPTWWVSSSGGYKAS